VHIRVICKDKKGLLAEVSNVISSVDVNIGYATIDTNKPDQSAVCDFQLEVHDLKHLNALVSALKKLKSVITVERVRGA
jgi:GTP pyrophosphokinase